MPDGKAPHALNSKVDVTSRQSIEFYECRGVPVVQKASFLSKYPWIIPFSIASFKLDETDMFPNSLPRSIQVYGRNYRLAGLTMHKSSHFTAIVFWRSSRYFYDGLQSSDGTRLRPVKKEDYKGQTGSYAIYLYI